MAGLTGNDRGRPGSRWRMAAWGAAAALILLPLAAMQVSDEVSWTLSDFILAGALLGGVGLTYEVAVRMTASWAYRGAVGLALAAALLLIWVNGAVGIIGSEDNPANRLFGGVLIVALLGAAIARFRPLGMARAMVATAVAQALVFAVVLIAGFGFIGPITVFFAALWLSSAWLFRKAAREQTSAEAA